MTTDAMGNPLTIAMLDSGLGETFTYDDAFHTLATAQTGKTTHGPPYDGFTYAYEKTLLGDATQFLTNTSGGTVYQQNFTYPSGSSRLGTYTIPQDQKFELAYDPVGRLSGVDIYSWNDPNWTYAMGTTAGYDPDGNMTSVLGASYVYDSRHLRTETVAALNAYTTHYYYDDAGHMLATHGCDDSSCTAPNRLFEYVWLGNEPMAIISTALGATGAPDDSNITGYALHNGLLGEPMRATGSSQAVVWWGDHEPYGERRPTTTSGTEPPIRLRLPGQVEDVDGPFHYNWHRYYWPGIGRYVQADPLFAATPVAAEAKEVIGPFEYASASPAVLVDPFGLWVEPVGFCPDCHGPCNTMNLDGIDTRLYSITYYISEIAQRVWPPRPRGSRMTPAEPWAETDKTTGGITLFPSFFEQNPCVQCCALVHEQTHVAQGWFRRTFDQGINLERDAYLEENECLQILRRRVQ